MFTIVKQHHNQDNENIHQLSASLHYPVSLLGRQLLSNWNFGILCSPEGLTLKVLDSVPSTFALYRLPLTV